MPFPDPSQLAFSFSVLGHEASARGSVPIQAITILYKMCITVVKKMKFKVESKPS